MTDETKGKGTDSLQPNDKAGQASGQEPGSTSGGEPKTYKEEDVQKVVSDALAAKGREDKKITAELEATKAERDSLNDQLANTKETLSELEKRLNQMEDESAKGDPDREVALRQKREAEREIRSLEERKREVVKREAQAKAAQESANKALLEATVKLLLAIHGIPEKDLKDLNISDSETLEKVAAIMAASKPKGKKKDDTSPPGSEITGLDSSMTLGGGGKPTNEQLEAMTPEQYADWYKKRPKK